MVATGSKKQLRMKKQTAWNTPPGATGGQLLRRVTSDLNLKKGTFESGELISTMQRRDFRHGTHTVEGTISGELSAGTYKEPFAALLRRAFSALTAISGASITIAGSGPTYTVTRAAGSFLTDGVKAGMGVRLTAGSFNAANLDKTLVVVSLTALVLTVMVLNGSALVAEGPIAAATLSMPGKLNYVPATGQTDDLFTFEHWHPDTNPTMSERFDDCKLNGGELAFPPQGMATAAFPVIGKTRTRSATQYFTTPTAETSTGLLSVAGAGLILVQGIAQLAITGLNLSIKTGMVAEPVAGSNFYADITQGRFLADGNFTALLESGTLRDYFDDETEVSIIVVAPASPAAAADFISIVLPRVKFGANDKDDGDKSLVQSASFSVLENTAGGAGTSTEQTSVWMQDSQA